jgi:hypothetical protein
MINNFEIIKTYLDFSNPDTYYFLQLIQRRKDNPDLGKDMHIIDDIFIYNMEQYERMESEIIATCKLHNARAYFRLNKRSLKKSAMQLLKKVTTMIIDENYKSVKNAYSSVSGEFNNDDDKKWIVDIDNVILDGNFGYNHESMLCTLRNLQIETGREPMVNLIPTKNGVHIITRPFNVNKFKVNYPNIDIHKDNPTVLYIP